MSVHVRFRVGSERYALPVENVLEVAEIGNLAAVPGAPEPVLGIRNLRGQVLPVVELAAVLGAERADEPARLLIVEGDGRRAGFVIDEVTDVGELPGDVQEAETDFLKGSLLAGSELVGLIDLPAVFAAVERRAAA